MQRLGNLRQVHACWYLVPVNQVPYFDGLIHTIENSDSRGAARALKDIKVGFNMYRLPGGLEKLIVIME